MRACTSSNSRTFSIAITAWSAKVVTSSICLSVNGSTFARRKPRTPMSFPSRSSGTPSTVRVPFSKPARLQEGSSGSATTSGIWTDLPSSTTRPTIDAAIRLRLDDSSYVRRDFGRKAVAGDVTVELHPRASLMAARVRLAQSCAGRLDQRIEHRLQIEGRAADDLEHVGGGGLLLQQFTQLVEQARVLDGDDGLTRKVGDQLDLLVG